MKSEAREAGYTKYSFWRVVPNAYQTNVVVSKLKRKAKSVRHSDSSAKLEPITVKASPVDVQFNSTQYQGSDREGFSVINDKPNGYSDFN